MEPRAKVFYERYVAACGGVWPTTSDHEAMERFEDLPDAERKRWEAVANSEAPRQPCHGSLLPPATGTLEVTGSCDGLTT